MSDANQTTNLEQFPDSAIEVVHGKVQRLNRIAMHRFPELRSGMELPGFLSTPLKDPDGAGTFTHQGVLYLFSRVAGTEGSLLLVRPAPKSGLTDRQLASSVRCVVFFRRSFWNFRAPPGRSMTAPSTGAFSECTACCPIWISCGGWTARLGRPSTPLRWTWRVCAAG